MASLIKAVPSGHHWRSWQTSSYESQINGKGLFLPFLGDFQDHYSAVFLHVYCFILICPLWLRHAMSFSGPHCAYRGTAENSCMLGVTLGLQATPLRWHKFKLELPVTLFPSGIVTLRTTNTIIHIGRYL